MSMYEDDKQDAEAIEPQARAEIRRMLDQVWCARATLTRDTPHPAWGTPTLSVVKAGLEWYLTSGHLLSLSVTPPQPDDFSDGTVRSLEFWVEQAAYELWMAVANLIEDEGERGLDVSEVEDALHWLHTLRSNPHYVKTLPPRAHE